ncbi:MAG: hypothetical protein QXU53_06680 [Thermosphaera sp.]
MRMADYLVLILSVSTLLGAASIIVFPSTIEYSVFNEGDTGFSKLVREFNGKIVVNPSEFSSVDPSTSIIITSNIGPASPRVAENLAVFVERGGVLIVTGDPSYMNSIAEAFGLKHVSSGKTVYDMVYNRGDRFKPVGYSRVCNCNVSLWKPYASDLSGENVLIETSPFSYLDSNGNGFLDLGEPIRVFPVGILYKYHDGVVFFILSTRVFTNDMVEFNKEFLECLRKERVLYIDQTTPSSKPFENLRFLALRQGNIVFAGVLAVIIVVVMLHARSRE